MRNPTDPQMRVLIAATRNGGRLPLNCLAYAGVFAPYNGIETIHAALTRAAQQRGHFATRRALLADLDHGQLLMAGGCVGIERRSTDSGFMLADDLAKALRVGVGRLAGITPSIVRACIRHGFLDERWNITERGTNAAHDVDPAAFEQATACAQAKAREAQNEPFAELIRDTRDDAAKAGTPIGLREALQAARDQVHGDALNEVCTARTNPAYPHRYEHDRTVAADPTTQHGHDTCGLDAAGHAEYTPERIRAKRFYDARYQRAVRNTAGQLGGDSLVEAEHELVDEAHGWAQVEHYYRLRDQHIAAGGIAAGAECYAHEGDYAGAVQWLIDARSSDFRDDSPAGLAHEDVSWVAASRKAVEQMARAAFELMAARRAAGAPDRGTPVDLVLIDDETAETFTLGENNTRVMLERIIRDGRDTRIPEAGPYGVADYTQPLTDFERAADVVQISRGKTVDVNLVVASALASGVTVTVTDLVKSDRFGDWTGLIEGQTGKGKTDTAAAMIGVSPAELSPAERDALADGIPPGMFARLLPGTHPDLADELRPAAEYVRDQVVAAITAASPHGIPAHPRELSGDPTEPGYRVRAHTARLHGITEAVRAALFHFELGLTAGSHNSRGMALAAMQKAAGKLGVPAYQPPAAG